MHDSSLPTSFLLLVVASLIVVEFAVGPPSSTTTPIVLASARKAVAGKGTPAAAASYSSCSLLDEEEWTRDEEDSIHRGTAAAAATGENHADDVPPSRSMMRLGREGCGRSFRLLTQEEQEEQQQQEEDGNVDAAAESRRRRDTTTTSALWDERSRCRCLTHLRSRFWTPLFFDEERITMNELHNNKNNNVDNNNKIPPAAPYETQLGEEQSSSSPTKREAESKGRRSVGWESLLSFASISERNGGGGVSSSTKRVSTSFSKFFESCWETAACVRRSRSARAEPTTTTLDEVEGGETAVENKKGSPKEHHHLRNHHSLGETFWDAALHESPQFSNATSLEEWSSRTTGTWLLEELSIAKLRECRHRRDDTGARQHSSTTTTTDTSKGPKEEVPTTKTCHVEYEHLSSLPSNYFGIPSRRSSSSERMPEQQKTKGTPLTKTSAAASVAGPPPAWKLSPAAESILGSAQPQEDIVVDDGYDASSSSRSFSSSSSPDGPSSSTDENHKIKKGRPQPHSSLMYVTQEISQFEATRHSRSSTSGFVSFAQHTNRTLIVRDADGRHPFLRDVSLALQYGVLGGVSEVGVSVYFTPLPLPATTTTADDQAQPQQQQHLGPGPTEVKSTVPPHMDAMDVLVYQVAGYKQWSLQQPHESFELPMQPVPLPLHAKHYHHHQGRNRRRRHAGGTAAGKHEKDIGAQVVHVVLGPGDWLYIPRGMIHNTTAVEGPQGSRPLRRQFKASSDHADEAHHRDAVVVEDHGSIHFSFGIDPKGERVPDRGFTWLGFVSWMASTRSFSSSSSTSSPFLRDEEILQADDDDKNEETPLRVAFESLLFSPQHRERSAKKTRPSPALFLLPEAAETFCRPLRRLVVPPHVMSLEAQLQRVEESLRTFLTLGEQPQSKRKPTTTTTASALVVLQRWRRLLQTSSSLKHLHTASLRMMPAAAADATTETLDAASRFFQRLSCAVAVLENIAQQATFKEVGVAARSPSSLSSSESLAAPVECEDSDSDVDANHRATVLRELLLRMGRSQPQQRAVVVKEGGGGGQSSYPSTFARTASTSKPSPQTAASCDEQDGDLCGVDLCTLQHPPQQTSTNLDVVPVGLATLYETVFADLLHMLPTATRHRASPDGNQPSGTEGDSDDASTKQSRTKTTPVNTAASSTRLEQRWTAWRKEASQRSLEERYAFAEWEWINSYLLYFSSTP